MRLRIGVSSIVKPGLENQMESDLSILHQVSESGLGRTKCTVLEEVGRNEEAGD